MSRSHGEREELVSRAFVSLADTLVDEFDIIDLLDRLVGFCVQLLPADAAGIVLGDARQELRAVAASDEAAHVMELLQRCRHGIKPRFQISQDIRLCNHFSLRSKARLPIGP